MLGSGNYAWLGGKSYEPYSQEFNAPLKRFIRKRDNNKCFKCEQSAKCVHHIDYNKKNSCPDNLITACRSCHAKTNSNRDYWKHTLQVYMNLYKGSNYSFS